MNDRLRGNNTQPLIVSQANQFVDLAHEDLAPTDEYASELVPQGTQETTGTRASFSSLIDYNPQGSSQQTSSSPPLQAAKLSARTVHADSVDVEHGHVRHSNPIVPRAETLRLRLRVALYKVRTNQTYVPMSCLEIPEKYQRKPAEEDTAELESPAASPEHERTAPTITVTEDVFTGKDTPGKAPKLLPAPVLNPTAYSSRFITEPVNLTSSPPRSATVDSSSTPRTRHPQEFVTPVASRQAATQLSSPPYSEDAARQRARTDSDNLTSSGVKGRAADGLLKLLRSV